MLRNGYHGTQLPLKCRLIINNWIQISYNSNLVHKLPDHPLLYLKIFQHGSVSLLRLKFKTFFSLKKYKTWNQSLKFIECFRRKACITYFLFPSQLSKNKTNVFACTHTHAYTQLFLMGYNYGTENAVWLFQALCLSQCDVQINKITTCLSYQQRINSVVTMI